MGCFEAVTVVAQAGYENVVFFGNEFEEKTLEASCYKIRLFVDFFDVWKVSDTSLVTVIV
jgi:hypothetical protein